MCLRSSTSSTSGTVKVPRAFTRSLGQSHSQNWRSLSALMRRRPGSKGHLRDDHQDSLEGGCPEPRAFLLAIPCHQSPHSIDADLDAVSHVLLEVDDLLGRMPRHYIGYR